MTVRLGLRLERPHLPDEAYYALRWWGVEASRATDLARGSTCCAGWCRWAGGLALCGAAVRCGGVVATDGARTVVVAGPVKSTFPGSWVTAVPALVTEDVLLPRWRERWSTGS